jgi:hypothetical protein
MKKYGVYVKFSSAEEFATLGGYFENLDNVIARTPAKNSANLHELKQSILELVNLQDRQEFTLNMDVPWQMHRFILGQYGHKILDLERSLKVKIAFPEREQGKSEVAISGMEMQVQQARSQIQVII